MKNKAIVMVGMLAGFLSASSASAMLIDFTDANVWSGVGGANPFTANVGSMDVTLTASIVPKTNKAFSMTFNGGADAPGAINAVGTSLKGQGDGIGIKLIGDSDEINANCTYQEVLTVTFAQSMLVQEIFLLDLFYVSGTSFEKAVYSINGIDTVFDAITPNSNTSLYGNKGFQTISLDTGIIASSISFWVAPPGPGEDGDNDYSLAGMVISEVPEPMTMLLFATGLAALAGVGRQRKK